MNVIGLTLSNSGSRIFGRILKDSGLFIGNMSAVYDTEPSSFLWHLLEDFRPHISTNDCLTWEFEDAPIPSKTQDTIEAYFGCLRKSPHWGCKHAYISLSLPWIVKTFPDAKYIRWLRDPRDTSRQQNKDELSHLIRFGLVPRQTSLEHYAAYLPLYWDQIIEFSDPQNLLTVRFEDFLDNPNEQLGRISDYLGIEAKFYGEIDRSRSVAWKKLHGPMKWPILEEYIQKWGYDLSIPSGLVS